MNNEINKIKICPKIVKIDMMKSKYLEPISKVIDLLGIIIEERRCPHLMDSVLKTKLQFSKMKYFLERQSESASYDILEKAERKILNWFSKIRESAIQAKKKLNQEKIICTDGKLPITSSFSPSEDISNKREKSSNYNSNNSNHNLQSKYRLLSIGYEKLVLEKYFKQFDS
jgi:hypothetical protein